MICSSPTRFKTGLLLFSCIGFVLFCFVVVGNKVGIPTSGGFVLGSLVARVAACVRSQFRKPSSSPSPKRKTNPVIMYSYGSDDGISRYTTGDPKGEESRKR